MLVYAFNWKKLSISAALGYRCRLWFQTQSGSYNDEPDCLRAGSEEVLARAEGDSDL